MPKKDPHSDRRQTLRRLLKETRQAAGISQYELADRIQQSQSWVSKMESGDQNVDLVQLQDVCRALGKDLLELVREFEEAVE